MRLSLARSFLTLTQDFFLSLSLFLSLLSLSVSLEPPSMNLFCSLILYFSLLSSSVLQRQFHHPPLSPPSTPGWCSFWPWLWPASCCPCPHTHSLPLGIVPSLAFLNQSHPTFFSRPVFSPPHPIHSFLSLSHTSLQFLLFLLPLYCCRWPQLCPYSSLPL